MIFATFIATSLITLHCEASWDEPKGPPVTFAITMDYEKNYAYFSGLAPMFDRVETTNLTVTPGKISFGPFNQTDSYSVLRGEVSRTDGTVEFVAKVPIPGEPFFIQDTAYLSGTCRPGELVAPPAPAF